MSKMRINNIQKKSFGPALRTFNYQNKPTSTNFFNSISRDLNQTKFISQGSISSIANSIVDSSNKIRQNDAEEKRLIKYISSYEMWPDVAKYMYGNGEYNNIAAKYITEDKQNFICYNDGLGRDDKNYGPGILHYINGNYQEDKKEYYKKVNIDITSGEYDEVGVSTIPVSAVLSVQQEVIKEKENIVINAIGENNYNKLTTTQQHCLIDIAYQGCDSWNTLKTLLDNGADAQTVAEKWPSLTSTTYNNQDRADARKELWLNGKYILNGGEELSISLNK